MTVRAIAEQVDALLVPLGFCRRGVTWNRAGNDFVDVIDVQTSKSHDSFTINAGVMNRTVHRICWGTDPPAFIEEPSCTVRARLGDLVDGRDRWWPLDGSKEITTDISQFVVPFLERMRSAHEMEAFLTKAEVVKRKYPLPIIYLAILKGIQGNIPEACAIFGRIKKSVIGPWRLRASEAAKRMGCTA